MQLPETRGIPRALRRAILVLMALSLVVSTGLSLHFLVIRPDRELAIVAIGAAQSALTGFVIVALVLFSFRMKQTRDIRAVIDDFFIDDVMTALQGVDTAPSPLIRFDTPAQFRKVVPQVKALTEVTTDFAKGRDAASFVLTKPGQPPFEIYLKANVRHLTIKYFFDPALFPPGNDEQHFRTHFEQTLAGAESVGYTHKLIRRYHPSKQADVLELSLYFRTEAEMLANPAERLFLSNDLRTMTASMLHTLNGVRAKRAGA